MSRIGKKPITVPAGVEVKFDGHTVTVKGPKGTLTRKLNEEIDFKMEGNEIIVSRPNDEIKNRSLHGLNRATAAQHDSRRNRRILQETGNPGRRLQCTDAGNKPETGSGLLPSGYRNPAGRHYNYNPVFCCYRGIWLR